MNFYLEENYIDGLMLCKDYVCADKNIKSTVNKTIFHVILKIVKEASKRDPANDAIDVIIQNLKSKAPKNATPTNFVILFDLMNKRFEECLLLCQSLDSYNAWNGLLRIKGSDIELGLLYTKIFEMNVKTEVPFNQNHYFRRKLLKKSFLLTCNLPNHQELRSKLYQLIVQEYKYFDLSSNEEFNCLYYSAIER